MIPSKIYWLPAGERMILYSFMRYELQQRKQENNGVEGAE